MSDKTRAKRQRAHRRKQKFGLMHLGIWVEKEWKDKHGVKHGFMETMYKRAAITPEEAKDPHKRAEIIGRYIETMLETQNNS